MSVDFVEGWSKVRDYVAAFERPAVVSIGDDTHIFHFSRDEDWQDGVILFVNRNGHHFRLLRPAAGDWLFCKTWNGMEEHENWMIDANLTRADPEALIRLCGVGPQGKQHFEGLCLLPKHATKYRRVVWRNEILEIRFNMDAGTFTLKAGAGSSMPFAGKPWESREAATWCLAHCGHALTPDHVTEVSSREAAMAQVELEGSAMWGMF